MRARPRPRARLAVGLAVAVGLALGAARVAADPAHELPSRAYAARLVHVRDGDSLIVSDGERQRDLRIAEIDAPERGQAWGERAATALTRLVAAQTLRVERVEIDRYGREVSRLWAGEACVACALVRGGHAWAYRKYLRSPELIAIEAEARAAGRGLWSLPASTFVPPWDWRHGSRVPLDASALAALAETPGAPPSDAACGAKRTCGEMSSCAEARFHLERCGLTRLDRDGDGVPCAGLCP